MAAASTPTNLLACRELREINDAGLAVGAMAQVHTQNLCFFFQEFTNLRYRIWCWNPR